MGKPGAAAAEGGADLLAAFQAFKALGAADRIALSRVLRVRKLSAKQALFQEGQPGESMFIIAEGSLRARAEGDAGKPLRDMGPGELVGEMTCIDPAPRSVTVHAVSTATVYELDRATLERLRHDAPRAAQGVTELVIRTVTTRLRELDRRIAVTLGEPEATPPKPAPAAAPEAPKAGALGRLVGWLRGSE